MKIVTTQPAKEGEVITVTDKQGRSYSAEAVTEIVDNKGVAFREGKIKVTGNSNSTQQSRTVLDRHTPKSKKVETTYLKAVSWKLEDDNYNIYVIGDRTTPTLIYSLPITDEIIWGNISTQSQGKNDWVVSILYKQTSTYYLIIIITPQSSQTYSESELSSSLRYLNPSGNGIIGYINVFTAFNDSYSRLHNPSLDSVVPIYQNTDHLIATNLDWETGGDWRNNTNPPPSSEVFGFNSTTNRFGLWIKERQWPWETYSGQAYRRNLTFYGVNFNLGYHSLLSDVFPKVTPATLPKIADVNNNSINGQSFFNGLIDFSDWVSPDFASQTTINLSDYFTEYPTTLYGYLNRYYLLNRSEALVDKIFPDVALDNSIQAGLNRPFSTLTRLGDPFSSSNSRRDILEYRAGYTTSIINIPFGVNNYLEYGSGVAIKVYSNLSAQPFFGELRYDWSGQTAEMIQKNINTTIDFPIINGNNFSVDTTSLNLLQTDAKSSAVTAYLTKWTLLQHDLNLGFSPLFYVTTYPKGQRINTGYRLTNIYRKKSTSSQLSFLGIPYDYQYDFFSFDEQEPLEVLLGFRLYYSIPSLRFYENQNSAIIEVCKVDKITQAAELSPTYTHQYWNGTSFSEVTIPDDSEYYLELRKGKIQGIKISDLELQKKEIDLHTWTLGSQLGTPKTEKVQVKKYPTGHTILSASYGK